jgi:Uma2 family endonuclease
MSTLQLPHCLRARQVLVLDAVDWRTYASLLRALDGRHIRLTYDQGTLEMMTLTHQHQSCASFLGRLAVVLTEELTLPLKGGGSTTFWRREMERGLEPDDCYWIASEQLVRGKRKIDLRVDPPPDLAIEVHVINGSLNRMGIYAAIQVPEIWRYFGDALTFSVMQASGGYAVVTHSKAFPLVTPADLLRFLPLRATIDENAVVLQFRTWVRQLVASNGSRNP